jgi:CSLREA domain-containing protein
MGRSATRGATALGAGVLLLVGAACEPGEPPPPVPHLVVTTTADLPDATPGDGTCEATVGIGDCTLRAAIDEGNALTRADITVPDGSYVVAGDVEVTGTLHVNHGDAHLVEVAGPLGASLPLEVAPGGVLLLEGVDLLSVTEVHGAFVGRRVQLRSLDASPLTVAEGGAALLWNARVEYPFGTAVLNSGTLRLDYTQVGGRVLSGQTVFDLGELWTAPGADTTTRGSWLASGCAGEAPGSLGYNADGGSDCELDGPGDLEGQAPVLDLGHFEDPVGLLDAIPAGEIGCGVHVTVDLAGGARPVDGDGDGIAACDIGEEERPSPVAP